jgi:mannose-1-phosphate guanylyltransferase/mannose-6-phosphate isomerase
MKEERPWGRMVTFARNEKTTVKIIEVLPGESLSLQVHDHRNELWVALDHHLIAEVGGQTVDMVKDQTVFIPVGTPHRASSKYGTRFLEISTGFYDDEDITRLEDKYGRT